MRCLSSPLVDCPASCSGRLLPQSFSLIHRPQRQILRLTNALIHPQHSFRGKAAVNGSGNGAQHLVNEEDIPKNGAPLVWTKFVAETFLPTGQGKFRLRGYRHTVRLPFSFLTSDGDLSFLATRMKNLRCLLFFSIAG